jgi:hypothetical protein
MRSGILRRIRALEQRLPDETKPLRRLPEWLIEGLAEQGIPCEASGMPEWEAVARITSHRDSGEATGRPDLSPKTLAQQKSQADTNQSFYPDGSGRRTEP